MGNGEQFGGNVPAGETGGNFDFSPEMSALEEQGPEELKNLSEQASENTPETEKKPENESENAPENEMVLGTVMDEAKMPTITEAAVLSTETGSIADRDGVDEETEREVKKLTETSDLRKRDVGQKILAKRLLVGRYADRAYLRGEKTA